MTLTLKPPKFGYVCGAAFDHELFSGGLNIYQSIEELKEHESCWKECGIVKVKFAVISRTKGKPKRAGR